MEMSAALVHFLHAVGQEFVAGARHRAWTGSPFVLHERREGESWAYIAVPILLHFVPRFQPSEPQACETTRAVL